MKERTILRVNSIKSCTQLKSRRNTIQERVNMHLFSEQILGFLKNDFTYSYNSLFTHRIDIGLIE